MFTQVDGVVRVPNRKGDLDVFFCSLDPSTGVLNVRKVKKIAACYSGRRTCVQPRTQAPPLQKNGAGGWVQGYMCAQRVVSLFTCYSVIALYISQRFYFEGGGQWAQCSDCVREPSD